MAEPAQAVLPSKVKKRPTQEKKPKAWANGGVDLVWMVVM
jgi:hypothetical protein